MSEFLTAQVRDLDNAVQAITRTSGPLVAPAGMTFVTLTQQQYEMLNSKEYAGATYNPNDGTFSPPQP